MPLDRDVVGYYDRLAPTYDKDRFDNSYGRFIGRQECAILSRLLPRSSATVLDLGCGTGRLTEFATFGCDASAESLRLAARKYSNRSFVLGDAASLPFAADCMDAVFCFHVLMHLDAAIIGSVLAEVSRILRLGGTFISATVTPSAVPSATTASLPISAAASASSAA